MPLDAPVTTATLPLSLLVFAGKNDLLYVP
jgi:hypothetical protein